jgi:hypothetical protein
MFFLNWLLRHPPIGVLLVVALVFLLMGLFPGSQWIPERASTQGTHARTAVAVPEWARPNCDELTKHELADVCEQRRMAQAAETTVLLNQWQIGLGILGFALVVVTLYYNRQATHAATVSANAATASVNAMMDGERPHMVLSRLKITGLRKPPTKAATSISGWNTDSQITARLPPLCGALPLTWWTEIYQNHRRTEFSQQRSS